MSRGEDRQMKMSVSEPTIMAGAIKPPPSQCQDPGEAATSAGAGAAVGPLHDFMVEGGVTSVNSQPDEGQNFEPKPNSGVISSRGTAPINTKQSPTTEVDVQQFSFRHRHHHHQSSNLSTPPFGARGTSPSDGHRLGHFGNPFENTIPVCDTAVFTDSETKKLSEDITRLDQRRQDTNTTTVDYPHQPFSSTISAFSSTPKTRNTSVPERLEATTANREHHSAATTPGAEMGFVNLGHSTAWGIPRNSIMMEHSETKDYNNDVVSSASTASATTLSPTIESVHAETSHVDPIPPVGRLPPTAVGTPSTVSTAPSTDDASFEHLIDPTNYDKLSLGLEEPNFGALQPRSSNNNGPMVAPEGTRNRVGHRRANSWDEGGAIGGGPPRLGASTIQSGIPNRSTRSPRIGAAPYAPSGRHGHADSWMGLPPSNFRNEQSIDSTSSHVFAAHSESWRQQRSPQYFLGQHQHQHQHQQSVLGQQGHNIHLPPSGAFHGRKGSAMPTTPPRGRNGRPLQPPHRQSNASIAPAGGTANPPRSSSEILKTLLRKKACLYEPETSRAVALVTWLVGRELALAHGYFSRQQLQSGVHACVARKIDAGSITRTKVNRCMQIILNSCFHYIIPRPDGSEENGETFRAWFEDNSRDDSELCKTLPMPWNDVVVDRDVVLTIASSEPEGRNGEKRQGQPAASPQSSPRFSSAETPPHFHEDGGDHGSKRAVLLCFNENVRSADDVFRCHNEFIRDTANAAKLQLSAQEWRAFFGRDTTETAATRGAAASPKHEPSNDYLGRMKENDLCNFRTTWCAKRYDHDHDLCGFAHFEVNGGWLRRNPSVHRYRNEMCPSIIARSDKSSGAALLTVNQCEKGVNCGLCHSREELLYHPSNYKLHICKACTSHHQQCKLGDICPNLHPKDSHHPTKKSPADTRHMAQQRHGNRQGHHSNFSFGAQGRGVTSIPPPGAPMLYVHPAPFSSFDRHLALPGLQSLFRRQSAVIRASLSAPAGRMIYSNFGDDWGIRPDPRSSPPDKERGLPFSDHVVER